MSVTPLDVLAWAMSHAKSVLPRFDNIGSFMDWADRQEGRWELHDGIPVAMAPERADHARIKLNACIALQASLRGRALHCEALIDGLMVPGPGLRRFIPDVVMSCGDRVDGDAIALDEPVILVEVLSPSTEYVDTGLKLESYLALPSLQHYLIVASAARRIVHHRRWNGDQFLTAIIRTGILQLEPPGLSIPVDDLYARTNVVL